MTLCVILSPDKSRTLAGKVTGIQPWVWLRGSDGGGVDEHDRNVVLDRVDATAFAAFQAGSVGVQSHRFLANRANQHIEKILGNHGCPYCSATIAKLTFRAAVSHDDDAIESLFDFSTKLFDFCTKSEVE